MSKNNNWYRLDNAAKIYPATVSKESSQVFRVAVMLHEQVDEVCLEKALNRILKRYPTIAVKMKKGIFWYYFEKNQLPALVHKEVLPPCSFIDTSQNNGYLFKVMYFNKRISLEFFHALTDGTGAFEFLKSVLHEYFHILYNENDDDGLVKITNEAVSIYETQDSFVHHFTQDSDSNVKEEKALHIRGNQKDNIKLYTGIISVCKLKEKLINTNTTITEFLAGLFIYNIYKEQFSIGKYELPIRLSVPVNLRKIFESRSMRNFSYFVNISVMPKENLSLEDCIKEVKIQLREGIKKNNLHKRICKNVQFEKNALLRITPLLFKDIVLKQVKRIVGDKSITATLTNPGIVRVPKSFEKHIDRFDVAINATKANPIMCGVCSYKDQLSITLTQGIEDNSIIKGFFKHLSRDMELEVKVYTNMMEVIRD